MFLIGSKLDKSYARSVNSEDQNEVRDKMECEPSAGSVAWNAWYNTSQHHAVEDDSSDEVITTTQLDLDMLFHQVRITKF